MMKKVILCVDDEEIVLDSLEMEINSKLPDYIIETAQSGQEALELLEELKNDGYEVQVVIADYIMPNMKGDELLSMVHQRFPEMVKIMLSGEASIEGVGNSVNQADLYRYISKPWDIADLSTTLKGAIKNYIQEKLLPKQNQELTVLNAELDETVQQRTVELEARSRQLEQTNKQLSRINEQLNLARKEADEANNAKSSYLANMSHELRTPINAILGYSEMLMDDANEAGNEIQEADLKKIYSAGRHLLDLINDILDLSKIEAGKMELNLEDCNLCDLIDEIKNTIQPLVEKNNNSLELIVDKERVPACTTDVTRIRQILFNLLSNACKFTDNGKISLMIERYNNGDHPWIQIKVRDTGVGLSQKQMAKLFQDFAQADASTAKKYGGTGLGLVISKKIAQLMGGDITVSSELGVGTTFTVNLPFQIRA